MSRLAVMDCLRLPRPDPAKGPQVICSGPFMVAEMTGALAGSATCQLRLASAGCPTTGTAGLTSK